MFDHDDRVAQIAEVEYRLQQALVISLVQPCARFVEYVHDASQTGADLCRQTDPLPLPTGQGGRRTIQSQVSYSDFEHELQPGADLVQQFGGDDTTRALQRQGGEELLGLGDSHGTYLSDAMVGHGDSQSGLRQARATAVRAEHLSKQATVAAACQAVARLLQPPAADVHEAFEGLRVVEDASIAPLISELDFLFSRAVQDDLTCVFG